MGVLALVVLLVAGCGGDDEDKGSVTTVPYEDVVPSETTESQTTTDVDPETETLPNDGDGTGTGTGEDAPGGAGDEVAAETQALFTGAGGAIKPRVIRVPAFISVRVELVSGDGGSYSLTFGDEKLQVGGELSSVGRRFDGLRPGDKLVGTGTGGKVTVEATAEPGP